MILYKFGVFVGNRVYWVVQLSVNLYSVEAVPNLVQIESLIMYVVSIIIMNIFTFTVSDKTSPYLQFYPCVPIS